MAKIYRYIAFIALLFNGSAAYAATACQVNYSIDSDWGNGFTTSVILTNQGDAWSGWDVKWTMPSGQQITELWNGQYSQTDKNVVVTSYAWNANIATGSTVQFGFNGSYSGENTIPYDITVNGELCSGQPDAPTDTGTDGNQDPTEIVCEASYVIREQWDTGFTTDVVIKNQGVALDGWNITWTMPSQQQVTYSWNGIFSQQNDKVTMTHADWNKNISSDGVISFGFNGSYSGENTIPYDITVNGELCSGQPDAPDTGTDTEGDNDEEEVVCEASYVIREQWDTGFTTDILIKNQGTALSDWKVTWTMPAAQQVTYSWNGLFSQQDNQVTITSADWNKNISSDGVIDFGFNGTYSGENPIPIDLAVNGVQCAGQPDSVVVRPNAPSALVVTMVDNTNAVLTWLDNSDNEDAFIIERRLVNQTWQQLQQTSADVIRYEDTTIGIGETYEYRLNAKNATGVSNYSNVVTATRQDHAQMGQQVLVDNCSSCHGSDGSSTGPATPTIAGLDSNYLIKTMAAYQTDARASTIMGRLARGYSTEQVALIANSLAAQTYTAATQETDASLVQLGRKIHDENCGVCHTDNGRSLVTGSPLAGQWKAYLEATLLDYLDNPPANVPAGMVTQINALESQYGATALAAIVDFYAANPDDTTGYDDSGDDGSDDTDSGTDGDGSGDTTTAPTMPTGLSSTAGDNERITLSWIDSSNNETGFKLERKIATGSWNELATLAANTNSYQDSAVSAGTQYTYRVTAYNESGSTTSAETLITLLTVLAYGQNEYINQGCATCHGATGAGGITNKPLTGFTTADLSTLTQINITTMPPANPAACVGNCAASIAQYIVDVLAADAGKDGDDPLACSGVAPASPRSLRLLTRYEYQNTVNDLLGLSVSIIHELPDENRVLGFDNNIAANQVTALRLEAFLNKAEDLAAQAVSERFNNLVPCQTTDTACAQQFISTFGKNAYRRPLTDAENTMYLAFFAQDSFNSAVEKTMMAMLSSPHMLYRSELGALQADGTYQLTAYEIASSLSYLFWGSMPDATLMQLADENALSTDAQRIAQAYRLLNDAQSRQQVGNFVGQWLLASNPYSLPEKDTSVYPDYTSDVRSSLSQELVNFFNHVAFDSSQKYSELFSSNYVLANNVLANFYGLSGSSSSSFAVTPVTDNTRTGILTLGAILAKYANSNESHPFKRGAFVFERLLCHDLPEAANMGIIATPVVDPDATTRERFAFHSESDTSCFSCHQYLDGPGFSLESYDGAGQFRATENGQQIDTTGILRGLETYTPDEQVSFANANQLSSIIAQSPTASQCIAKQYYRYVAGREETTADSCAMDAFLTTYQESDYNLQTMLLGIVNAPNFIKRQAK